MLRSSTEDDGLLCFLRLESSDVSGCLYYEIFGIFNLMDVRSRFSTGTIFGVEELHMEDVFCAGIRK